MAGSAEILVALRELANTKQIDRTEIHELLRDGILAALAPWSDKLDVRALPEARVT